MRPDHAQQARPQCTPRPGVRAVMRATVWGALLGGILLAVYGSPAAQPGPARAVSATAPALRYTPDQLFHLAGDRLQNSLAAQLDAGNPYILYSLATYMLPLLSWLEQQPGSAEAIRFGVLQQAAELYNATFTYLQPAREPGSGVQYQGWLCRSKQCTNWNTGAPQYPYRGQEVLLVSAQHLAGVTAAIKLCATIPPAKRTAAQQSLLRQSEFIAATYARWLTGDRRRDAQAGALDAAVSVSDKSMLLATGILHLLAARDAAGEDSLAVPQAQLLRAYALETVWPRFAAGPHSRTRWFDSGRRAVFDPTWTPLTFAQDNRSAFYESARPPAAEADCPLVRPARDGRPAAQGMSMDLSHSWRLVPLLDAYSRYPDAHVSAEARRIIAGLANQLLDQVWNGDLAAPAFRNSFGDSNGYALNGWFSVAFDAKGRRAASKRERAPWALGTQVAPLYFCWADYDPSGRLLDIATVYYHSSYDKYYNPMNASGKLDNNNLYRAITNTSSLPPAFFQR